MTGHRIRRETNEIGYPAHCLACGWKVVRRRRLDREADIEKHWREVAAR